MESEKIVIPIIQRDYAQGRTGKEYLRKRFLGQLFTALQGNDKPLVLDFVYGSAEAGSFYPLDGQQRLTTLWLLHWYLALCAGTLTQDKVVLQRFSYETRVSSRTFCHKLCEINESYKPQNHGIAAFIRNQRWYYSAYEQDSTIQSMLRTLNGTDVKDSNETDITDGIEEYFIKKCAEGDALELLRRLKEDEAPIQFCLLNMEDKNMPLTDDMHVKMYGVMLDPEIHKMRDSYLNRLLKDGKIELTDKNRRIADTGLFWGNLSINFIYHVPNGKNLYLQWYQQRDNKKYDIYLMTQDWNNIERKTKLENERGDRQNFYCFNIEKPTNNISDIEHFCQQVETEFKEFIGNNNI